MAAGHAEKESEAMHFDHNAARDIGSHFGLGWCHKSCFCRPQHLEFHLGTFLLLWSVFSCLLNLIQDGHVLFVGTCRTGIFFIVFVVWIHSISDDANTELVSQFKRKLPLRTFLLHFLWERFCSIYTWTPLLRECFVWSCRAACCRRSHTELGDCWRMIQWWG